MVHDVLMAVVFGGLLVVNAAAVVLVLFQLPGTWLILLATAGVSAWQWTDGQEVWVGLWTLVALAVVAGLGEILELLAGMAGAVHGGGSKRGALGALLAGMVGAVLASVYLPFLPVIAALLGAAVGAALGSVAGDLWAGRTAGEAFRAGRAAAVGRVVGALTKLGVALVMWVIVLVAMVW